MQRVLARCRRTGRRQTIVRSLRRRYVCAAVVLAAIAALGPQPAMARGSRPAVSVGGANLAAVDMPSQVPSQGPTPVPVMLTPEEAEAQDMALVAESEGWTIEEAAAHRHATDVVGDVAEKVAAARPNVFIGSVAPSEPGEPPSLYIKGRADRTVRDLVAGAEVPIILVDNQPFSLDELEERKLVVHRALENRGFKQISTGFSVTGRGQITASVTREPGLPADPSAILEGLPSAMRGQVELTVSDEPIAWAQHAYGGMFVRAGGQNICTSGWSVYATATGTTGVTTAGHCTGINEIVEPGAGTWALTHQQQHRSAWGDVEWLTSTHIEPAQFYSSPTEVRRATALEALASISEGETVCVYGRFSNSRNCTRRVAQVSRSCTFGDVVTDRLVRMDGEVTIGGDSGAPWFSGNRVYGSHVGLCGGGSVFSVADLYDEALNVRVRLAQRLSTRVALYIDDSLVSPDGRFTALMQSDGNFVIYQSGVGAIWATGTNGSGGVRIIMQADGNLVIYRSNGSAAWATGTSGSDHYLYMQNDGNLVMYRGSGGAAWASGTCCR